VGPMRHSLLITLAVLGLAEGKTVVPASALQAATTTESPCDACKAIVEDGKARFVAKHAAASSSNTAKLAAFKSSYYSAFIDDCAAHPALGASNCVHSLTSAHLLLAMRSQWFLSNATSSQACAMLSSSDVCSSSAADAYVGLMQQPDDEGDASADASLLPDWRSSIQLKGGSCGRGAGWG